MTTLPEAHPAQSRRLSLEPIVSGLSGASRLQYTLYVYLASRVLYLLIAGLAAAIVNIGDPHAMIASSNGTVFGTPSLGSEMSNWDGYWYLTTAAQWYWHHPPTHVGEYSTLGFMPLYPMLIWLVAHVTQIGNLGAGLMISLIAGGVATVLIGQLAEQWWGAKAARRSILFWCFFPGTVVFSMAYTEGLTLALIAGAILLLARKRWFWAGVCAGFSTAIAPVALAAIPMCAAAAGRELWRSGSRDSDQQVSPWSAAGRPVWRRGWQDLQARRALVAPILSTFGVIGFAIFLWFWTGSPLADYTAQHVAWSESTTPLAMPRVLASLIHQLFISGVGSHGPGGIDLNGIAALLGTVFLFWGLKLLWEHRARVPLTAWVWTICVALLALTSAHTPPNPRMLVVAFPVVMVVGAVLDERRYSRALGWAFAATLVMTPLTYVGMWLRP